jgi:type VI secretion system protein ImpC
MSPEVKTSQQAPAKTTTTAAPRLLDQILAGTALAKKQESTHDLIRELAEQVSAGHVTIGRDVEATINSLIAQTDKLISQQLDEIMHHPEFQKLEASWRGLKYLLDNTETSTMMKIRVLNVSKRELLRDLERAAEFDQSALFQRVYNDGIGIYGGQPMGAMIGDFEFTNHPEDMELLKRIAEVAAASHAPFLTGVGAGMFGLESFTEIESIRDIAKKMDTPEYATWRSFRASEDSRYVGLCMPHVLMRLPYGKNTRRVEEFDYEEGVDGTDHSRYLWGNAAYALATRLTASFAEYHWCSTIRGPAGGGRVDGLPVHNFKTPGGDIAMKCPTEVQIPDRREKELADAGFIPFVHCVGENYGAFFSVQSAQQPKKYDKDAATASARLSAQLPYIFSISRFAHYLKAMMRDNIGSYTSRSVTQRELKNWIHQYVTDDDDASPAVKAQFPLREADVEVLDVPGHPGAYRAVMHLRPHFQLDEIKIALRLVAELPQTKQG